MTDCTIVCQQDWIWDAFTAPSDAGMTPSNGAPAEPSGAMRNPRKLRRSLGLWPIDDLRNGDALWAPPAFLIAQNARMRSRGLDPMLMLAPPQRWPGILGMSLMGRTAITARASTILQWKSYREAGIPERDPHRDSVNAGARPWSQLANGRVDTFPAAQRSLEDLQSALAQAPADSLILVSEHVADITEEWMVAVHDGHAIASSGYCVHDPSDSRSVLSVFDGARFANEHRMPAEELAVRAASRMTVRSTVLNIAFRMDSSALVLEALPMWCTPPYAYSRSQTDQLLMSISGCSLRVPASTARSAHGLVTHDNLPVEESHLYRPDPWMEERFGARFIHESHHGGNSPE
jgi:hypothetical protein